MSLWNNFFFKCNRTTINPAVCKNEEKKNKDIRDQAQFKLLCAKDNWQMFDKDFIDDALKIYNICLKRILISN